MGKLIIQVSDLKSLIKEKYLVRPHNRRYSRRAVAYAYKARQRGLTPEQMMAAANQMNNNPFSGGSNDFRRGADLNVELGQLERDKRRLEIEAIKSNTNPLERASIKNRMDIINKRLDENVITLGQLGGYGMPKQGNSVDLDYENDGSFIGDNNTEITSGSSNMNVAPSTRFYKQLPSEPSVVGDFIPPPVEAFEPDFTYQGIYEPTKPFELTNTLDKTVNPIKIKHMRIIKQVPDDIPPPVADAIYEYEDPFVGYIPEAERIGGRRTKYQIKEAEMMGAEDKPVVKRGRGRPKKKA
jgi:hypothetical protein